MLWAAAGQDALMDNLCAGSEAWPGANTAWNWVRQAYELPEEEKRFMEAVKDQRVRKRTQRVARFWVASVLRQRGRGESGQGAPRQAAGRDNAGSCRVPILTPSPLRSKDHRGGAGRIPG